MRKPVAVKSDHSAIRVMVLVSTLTIGGAEQLLVELLSNIDRKRFDLNLCFLGEPGLLGEELLSHALPATANVCRSRLDLMAVLRLARLFRAHRVDVLLLINHRNSIFFGIPAAILAGVGKIVNWQNETFREYSRHWLTMVSRRIFLLGIGKVVAAAKGHGEYIAAFERVPRNKIHVIYNGVDPERLKSTLSITEAKERIGLTPTCPVVTMIAALRADKAHDILLHAAVLVLRSLPDTRFLIVGDGPKRGYLEKLAEELGVRENVLFLGFRRDIADILRATDIVVLSTRPLQETLSVAAIEAMAAGLPVVSTDVGFMREIVLPGITGELVRVEDRHQLAEVLIKVLKDHELRRQMGANARQLVLSKFTVEIMVKGFENLMEESA